MITTLLGSLVLWPGLRLIVKKIRRWHSKNLRYTL